VLLIRAGQTSTDPQFVDVNSIMICSGIKYFAYTMLSVLEFVTHLNSFVVASNGEKLVL